MITGAGKQSFVQRHLGQSTERVTRSFERLSSGLRINRASDDAAGLAVASLAETQARILARGRLNTSDAVSLLNVADGAISEISGVLQRQAELAEQALNGTLSFTQRSAVNAEAEALNQEIRRIADSTSFNGISLLSPELDARTEDIIIDGAAFTEGSVLRVDPTGRYAQVNQGIPAVGTFTLYDKVNDSTTAYNVATVAGFGTGGELVGLTVNGKAILAVENGASRSLVSYDIETQEVATLTNSLSSLDASLAAVSADGATIAFSSRSTYDDGGSALNPTGSSGTTKIYTVNIETGIVRGNGADVGATLNSIYISSDGSQVAYRKTTGAAEYFNTSGATTSGATVLAASGVTSILGIANDGTTIVESSADLAGGSLFTEQLYAIDAQSPGVDTRLLTDNAAALAGIATLGGSITPDGSKAFFTSTRDFTGENPSLARNVFELDVASGEIRQLSELTLSSTDTFHFAHDGNSVYFQQGGEDVYSLDLRPQTQQLTFDTGYGVDGNIVASVSAIQEVVSGLGVSILTSQIGAGVALERAKTNIAAVSNARGEIGASLSRLSVANGLLQAQSEELRGAASKIFDVDVATESADLIRNQIVQQAGVAVLAQLNQNANLALQLLEE